MAKATIVEVKHVKPDEKVMLELSIEEASILYAVVGSITAVGTVSYNLGSIFKDLKEIQRVKAYGNDIVMHICKGGCNLKISDGTIPEEK
jgi:hypothetical protein